MGEISDYYRDIQMDYEFELESKKDELFNKFRWKQDIFWTTMKGEKINIKDLAPDHKQNIIKMLEKGDRYDKEEWLIILNNI